MIQHVVYLCFTGGHDRARQAIQCPLCNPGIVFAYGEPFASVEYYFLFTKVVANYRCGQSEIEREQARNGEGQLAVGWRCGFRVADRW